VDAPTDSSLNEPSLVGIAGNPEYQDHGCIIREGLRTVLCVSDGAGGVGGGIEAAEKSWKSLAKVSALLIDSQNGGWCENGD
jgi:hypothetical protein